jgi:hypothetical protein
MKSKKASKGTTSKKTRKGALKDLGPTARRGGAVKGGLNFTKKGRPTESV